MVAEVGIDALMEGSDDDPISLSTKFRVFSIPGRRSSRESMRHSINSRIAEVGRAGMLACLLLLFTGKFCDEMLLSALSNITPEKGGEIDGSVDDEYEPLAP
jgi:hypothetical protein